MKFFLIHEREKYTAHTDKKWNKFALRAKNEKFLRNNMQKDVIFES